MWIKFFVPLADFERDEWESGPDVIVADKGCEYDGEPSIEVMQRVECIWGGPGKDTHIIYSHDPKPFRPVNMADIQVPWVLTG